VKKFGRFDHLKLVESNLDLDPSFAVCVNQYKKDLKEFDSISLYVLENGADSYLIKPFNEHYLQSRLNQVMENRELLASRDLQDVIDFEGTINALDEVKRVVVKEFKSKIIDLYHENLEDDMNELIVVNLFLNETLTDVLDDIGEYFTESIKFSELE